MVFLFFSQSLILSLFLPLLSRSLSVIRRDFHCLTFTGRFSNKSPNVQNTLAQMLSSILYFPTIIPACKDNVSLISPHEEVNDSVIKKVIV